MIQSSDTKQTSEKIKMPISLKFAVGFVFVRIFFGLFTVALQLIATFNPTADYAIGIQRGLKASFGDEGTNSGYVVGYLVASLMLVMPIVPAAFKRSKRWLTAARVCIVVEMLSNFGKVNIAGAIGDIILACLLFSKGGKKYVAEEAFPTTVVHSD